MTKITKKRKDALSKYDNSKTYSLEEASSVIKEISNVNFDSSIDLAVRLNLKWKLSSIQEPITYYRYHGNNTGNKESHLISSELKLLKSSIFNSFNFFLFFSA